VSKNKKPPWSAGRLFSSTVFWTQTKTLPTA